MDFVRTVSSPPTPTSPAPSSRKCSLWAASISSCSQWPGRRSRRSQRPGTPRDAPTRVVKLPESTRRDNLSTFPHLIGPRPTSRRTASRRYVRNWRSSRIPWRCSCGEPNKAYAFDRVRQADSYDPIGRQRSSTTAATLSSTRTKRPRPSQNEEGDHKDMARIKMAYIGGGSSRAAGTMASFLWHGPEFAGSEVVLIDQDPERLETVRRIAEKFAVEGGDNITVTATTDQRAGTGRRRRRTDQLPARRLRRPRARRAHSAQARRDRAGDPGARWVLHGTALDQRHAQASPMTCRQLPRAR